MKKHLVVGVDFGGTRIKIALVDARGHIRHRTGIDVRRSWPKETLLKVLAGTIEEFLSCHAVSRKDLLGIGIGFPGLVDYPRGWVQHLVNVRGFRHVPAASLLRKKLKLPVFIDNDVNLMALGEATYGAARGFSQVVCITLGTGVGGGIILNGELYRGASFSAGEIGHVPVSRGGPLCACGNRGCFEAYVGNRTIVRKAKRRIRAGERSIVRRLVDGKLDRITPEILSRAARKGDRLSLSIWKEAGEWIGVALAGIVNVHNPERIVIGGGVADAGEFLFRPIRQSLRRHALAWPLSHLSVVRAKLGNDAGMIGASVLVRRSLP